MGSASRVLSKRSARTIHNAVHLASETRELSHEDVSLDMMAALERHAIRLCKEHPAWTATQLAGELLRELNAGKSHRRRRPSLLRASDFANPPKEMR
jgi:hypothetical protein